MRAWLFALILSPSLALAASSDTQPAAFVEVASDQGGHFFSQVIYAPPINGLMSWGTRVHGQPIRTHETQHFLVAENKWIDAFPPERAEVWATQPYKTWGDWNCCSPVGFFYERDGVRMPRPNTSFYQVTWDTLNRRVLYYLGSMTISYEPVSREWKVIHDKNVKDQPPALLLWGSLCYDPVNKQALLFGGGGVNAPDGNPHTWALDVTTDRWRKLDLAVEPPPRCNSRMVYDTRNKVIVLFGGDGQDRGLADTWVFDVTKQQWQERRPAQSPHPRWNHAMAFLEKSGLVLLVGGVAQAPWQQAKDLSLQTWTYNAATNTWTPLAARPPAADWISMENIPGTDEVVLVTSGKFNHARKTFRFTYDPSAAPANIRGVPPGTASMKSESTPQAFARYVVGSDDTHARLLRRLPPNEWVEVKPPMTIVYDEKRERLIFLSGDKDGPALWFLSMKDRTWVKNPDPAPGGVVSREAVYVSDQDAVLAYGPAAKDDPVWTRVYLCAENRWVPVTIKTPQYAVYEVGLEYDSTHKVAVFLWYPSFEAGIRPHLLRLDTAKLPKP